MQTPQQESNHLAMRRQCNLPARLVAAWSYDLFCKSSNQADAQNAALQIEPKGEVKMMWLTLVWCSSVFHGFKERETMAPFEHSHLADQLDWTMFAVVPAGQWVLTGYWTSSCFQSITHLPLDSGTVNFNKQSNMCRLSVKDNWWGVYENGAEVCFYFAGCQSAPWVFFLSLSLSHLTSDVLWKLWLCLLVGTNIPCSLLRVAICPFQAALISTRSFW